MLQRGQKVSFIVDTNPEFISLLNDMRRGEISPSAARILHSLSRPLSQGEQELLPTELFPLRADVDRANAARMTPLPGSVYRFAARDSGQAPLEKRRRLLENMTAVMMLELKSDAQVMLVKNVSETLVNGTVGKVVGFFSDPDQVAAAGGGGGGGSSPGGQKVDELLPLVEFKTFKGNERVLVCRDEFRQEDADGNLLARRVQVSPP